jgi:hypothetical protein
MSTDAEPKKRVPRGLDFNPDVAWQKFVYEKYEKVIARIAFKYCMSDADLREDLAQEAMIALMTVKPEEIKGYGDFQSGLIADKEWARKVDTYLRQVARNSVLAPLASTSAGNWYVGRKKRRKNPVTGEVEYVSTPAIYVQLDTMLSAPNRIQIGTDGVLHIEGRFSRQESFGEKHTNPKDN